MNKITAALRTANRVRGVIGHNDVQLLEYCFSKDGLTYRARYQDNRDRSAAGVYAVWSATYVAGCGVIDVRREPRRHSAEVVS